MSSQPLFAYGTLMCRDIMHAVTSLCPAGTPARLAGFRRMKVNGEAYPGLIEDNLGEVEGVLYRGIDAVAWERLDRFEGEMYRRIAVRVRLPDATTVTAQTYLVNSDHRHHLDAEEWSFAEFLHLGKVQFQTLYPGFEAI